MSQHTILARHYRSEQPIAVTLAGDRIASVQQADVAETTSLPWVAETTSLPWVAETTSLPWVAPALFDLQVNGYGGVWFCNTGHTTAEFAGVIAAFERCGVTRLLPTLITAGFDSLRHGFETLERTKREHPETARAIAGYHLEGPYISPVDGPRGAHPREHVRPADIDEFRRLQSAANGCIRLVTLAPEVPAAVDFIRAVTRDGVRVAIGHTAASREQLDAAVDAGATLSTHLGNGAAPTLPRHPNVIWDQLGDDRLTASLISDGVHLPQRVLQSLIRGKTPARCIITCDASGWAGCPPGAYGSDIGRVEVLPDGRIVVARQRTLLAGSGSTTPDCVGWAASYGGVSLGDACDMAGNAVRTFFGEPAIELEAGHPADLILFDWSPGDPRLRVRTVFAGRELVTLKGSDS